MNYIDIGFGNIVSASRILVVSAADSSPIRRVIQDSKDRGMCIDCCAGKKCKSVIVTDSDHVILSSLEVAEINERLKESGTNGK